MWRTRHHAHTAWTAPLRTVTPCSLLGAMCILLMDLAAVPVPSVTGYDSSSSLLATCADPPWPNG